jgi:hypothetical protein
MAGLDPAIHVFDLKMGKTWMPATRPGMTSLWSDRPHKQQPSLQMDSDSIVMCGRPPRIKMFLTF